MGDYKQTEDYPQTVTLDKATYERQMKRLMKLEDFAGQIEHGNNSVVTGVKTSNCKWHDDGKLPANGEIFVFGSNMLGHHIGGAANEALKHGACWGVALGLFEKSYAIATLDEKFGKLSLETIRQQVELLRRSLDDYYVDNGVFVTRIGCGIAGFKDEEIAPMFKWATEYGFFSLPEPWRKYFL